MPRDWVLVLEAPNGDAARRIGGLSLVLRLALDARAAGASGVVLVPAARPLRGLLGDPRLRIPLLDEPPAGARVVRAPATLLCHRRAFAALLEAPGEPDLHELSSHAPAPPVPWSFSPIDVTDRASARVAERALFRSLRKAEDGWTSRALNRHVSLAISRWLVKTPLTPNQVSVLILAVGLAGAVLAARGDRAAQIAGAFLFQMQSILDGCDGEMSRVSHRGSLLGEWLDTIGDDLTNYAFFAGAAWGLGSTSGQPIYLVAGAVTVACGLLTSGLEYRYLASIGSGDLLKYPLSRDGAPGPLAAVQPLFKRDTFVFLTFVAALANLLGPMLLVFAVAAIGILSSVLATEWRLARERRAARERA